MPEWDEVLDRPRFQSRCRSRRRATRARRCRRSTPPVADCNRARRLGECLVLGSSGISATILYRGPGPTFVRSGRRPSPRRREDAKTRRELEGPALRDEPLSVTDPRKAMRAAVAPRAVRMNYRVTLRDRAGALRALADSQMISLRRGCDRTGQATDGCYFLRVFASSR
jgi:hypothetical protein